MAINTISEAEVVAQLAAQHVKYTANPLLVGSDVQADHDARVAAANAAHVEVTNDTFTSLNTETISGRVNGERYTGGNVVAPVNATLMEANVRAALDAGELYTHGGPYTDDISVASPYVDGLSLTEASKLTGERFF